MRTPPVPSLVAAAVPLLVAGALCWQACSPVPPTAPPPAPYVVNEKSLAALASDLGAGRVTSAQLTGTYLARIRALDQSGPALRSVLATNPNAAADARRLDAERAQGRVRGALHGIPILLKDNIESAEPLPTTAGSLALVENVTRRDAPIVARLRAAGAVVLGKTNLSEWANFRSTTSTSGWSAVGGLTKNPYLLTHNACGSSSGSGVAVTANLAAAAIGTETDGSVTCPAAINGLVGLKPTVGLVSRRHIVPISSAQDTAGPMTRTVADAAALLTVIAGSDEGDPSTKDADAKRSDYTKALSPEGLKGRRLGVMRFSMGYLPALDGMFDTAVATLRAAGAQVVEIDRFGGLEEIRRHELTVLLTDFRDEINAYLGATPPAVRTRTLADLLGFNRAHAEREMPHFQQELFEQSEKTAGYDRAAYRALREGNRQAAGPKGIDAVLKARDLDALIAPTTGPAWPTDLVNGDRFAGSATALPAIAGYPHLTVPMGLLDALPVGLSFIGPAWSEAALLAMGYAFEQRTHARRPPLLPPLEPR
jgi:amidase